MISAFVFKIKKIPKNNRDPVHVLPENRRLIQPLHLRQYYYEKVAILNSARV